MKKDDDKKVFICIFAILVIWVALVSTMLYNKYKNPVIAEEKDVSFSIKPIYIEVEKVRYATEKENIEHREEEIEALCKCVWGEARGCSLDQQAGVVWCVLNRVEDERFPNDIISVLEQPGQFDGYNLDYPVDNQIYALVVDVFNRWSIEQESLGSVGRVLPKEYMWFAGNGMENIFRDAYNGDYNIWDWSLESPYKED